MHLQDENKVFKEINDVLPNFLKVEFSQVEIPSPSINKSNNWVTWGDNNSFFQTLIKTLEQSSIHNSATRYKATLYAGESWKITNQNELNQNEVDAVNSFLSLVNVRGQSIIDVLQKVCLDLSLTGNGYLQPIWSKDKKKIVELYHLDASCLAPEKMNSEGIIENYYFSSDWSKSRREEYAPIAIPTFNTEKAGGRQIIPLHLNYTTSKNYFGVPDFLPALSLIELQEEIALFWLNFIRTGCFGQLVVTFPNGVPSEEIQKKIEREFRKIYSGKERKHVFLNFANNKDSAPIIETLSSTDLDKSFTIVQSIVNESISTAHKITNQRIFGINSSGAQLGQKDELLESFHILMNTTIYPVQIKIEKIINSILAINGFNAKIELVEQTPLEFMYSEQTLNSILSKDELRQRIGYAPISTDKEIKPSLIEILGVGGMQSLTAILSSALTPEKQLAILINVFAIEEDKAKQIIQGLPL